MGVEKKHHAVKIHQVVGCLINLVLMNVSCS